MRKNKIKNLVMCSLFVALIAVGAGVSQSLCKPSN